MFGKKRERAKLPGFCELSVAFLPQIVKGRSRPTKERLRPYLLGELIYFFLYGGVVIPSGLKPLFTLRAVAPLALQDFSGKLVDRFTGALLRSDEGREACRLQLLQRSLRIRFDLEGADLNLVEVSDLHHVGVEAFPAWRLRLP